jgi:hypothetical protein
MVKARTSFPSVIYEDNDHHDESVRVGKVADIMGRYYTRIAEIVQEEIMKQNELAGIKPEDTTSQSTELSTIVDSQDQVNPEPDVSSEAEFDTQEPLDIIHKSRRTVKRISTAFNRTDDDMKKLEREGQILSIVIKNLNAISRKYFGE